MPAKIVNLQYNSCILESCLLSKCFRRTSRWEWGKGYIWCQFTIFLFLSFCLWWHRFVSILPCFPWNWFHPTSTHVTRRTVPINWWHWYKKWKGDCGILRCLYSPFLTQIASTHLHQTDYIESKLILTADVGSSNDWLFVIIKLVLGKIMMHMMSLQMLK